MRQAFRQVSVSQRTENLQDVVRADLNVSVVSQLRHIPEKCKSACSLLLFCFRHSTFDIHCFSVQRGSVYSFIFASAKNTAVFFAHHAFW